MKYPQPNYTQIPNKLLDEDMATMKEAELRVLLALCRQTFGYHRDRVRYSLTKLEKATGLSRQGVLNGIESAEKNGWITGERDGGVTCWVVNVVDQVVNLVDQTSQRSRPPSIKENIKESEIKKEIDADASITYEPCDDDGNPIKPKKVKITKEPTHPAIIAYRRVTGRYPARINYDRIIEVVGDSPDEAFMHKCFSEWMTVSQNPAPYKWLFEWYAKKSIQKGFTKKEKSDDSFWRSPEGKAYAEELNSKLEEK